MKIYNQLNLQLKFAMRITFALATLAAATSAIDLQLDLFTQALLNDDEVAATTEPEAPIDQATRQ